MPPCPCHALPLGGVFTLATKRIKSTMKTGVKWQLKVTMAICIAVAVPSQSQTSSRASEVGGNNVSGSDDVHGFKSGIPRLTTERQSNSLQQLLDTTRAKNSVAQGVATTVEHTQLASLEAQAVPKSAQQQSNQIDSSAAQTKEELALKTA